MRHTVSPDVQRAADEYSRVYKSLRRDGVDGDAAHRLAWRAGHRLLSASLPRAAPAKAEGRS
jgi:hypothetical protein